MTAQPEVTFGSTTTSITSTTSTGTTIDAESATGDVVGFDTTEISLDGRTWIVALADSPALRQQGLMFVEDLGELDGMLFVFEEERSGAFWMKNTLIALDIAFFDNDGAFVGGLSMVPCAADPCPHYDVGLPYRFALEAPAGALVDLPDDARLDL
ncbi:MAG: DUF192 domain-containing protein [Acidimicrobiia bacterium]|nr:DUF192 domain-containing protein [Acidimicrobiia bacterium]